MASNLIEGPVPAAWGACPAGGWPHDGSWRCLRLPRRERGSGASYGIVCSVSSCAAAAVASTVYLCSRRGGVRRAKEIPPIVPARLGVAPCEQSRSHQPELASSSLKLSSVGIDSLKAEREYCARREVLTWQAAETSQTELRNIRDHVAVGFFSSEEFLQPSESTDDTGAVAVEMRRQIARAIGEDGAECGGEKRPTRSATRSPSSAAEARAGICSRFSMRFAVRLGAKAMCRLP